MKEYQIVFVTNGVLYSLYFVNTTLQKTLIDNFILDVMKLIMEVCKDHSSIKETTTFTSYYFRKVFLYYEINALMMCREQITLRIEVLSNDFVENKISIQALVWDG